MDPSEIECDICGKDGGPNVGFHCATCARSAIYSFRIEHAATLLDKESLEKRVEAVVHGASEGSSESITLGGMLVDTSEAAKATNHERTRSALEATRRRVDVIVEQAKRLRHDMEEQKKAIEQRKARVAQRRSDAESAKHGLGDRSARQLEEVEKGIKHISHKWQRTHVDTVQSRVLLCREAAILADLKLRKVRKDETTRHFYSIGGHEVFDLRSLNSAGPRELSASLSNLAHLLVRVSQYLSVRLPAEIVLPRRDYPLPTIFSPNSSYSSRDIPFPGVVLSRSGINSPSASRQDIKKLPRPRVLWTDKRIQDLVKEDSSAYSMFIEGISFLAWDIAWLCRTQSMDQTFESWEDVCPMGKNLWQLLAADRRKQMPRRESSTKDSRTSGQSGAAAKGVELALGQYSHGSTHSFLAGGEMTQYMREWKLRSPAELVLKVRSHLISEMQGAEWDIIDHDNELSDEEPDIVGTRVMIARPNASRMTSMSKASESGAEDRSKQGNSVASQQKGANGWTKVRSRNGDVAKA